MKHKKISVVVPVYKEEGMIRAFLKRIEPVLKKITTDYEIIFCLDPSPDTTESIICQEIERNPKIKLITFSRRFGQPAATMAGIFSAKFDACVIIDVDLQDPPELIEDLLKTVNEGYEVVYATRRRRAGEPWFRLLFVYIGYKVINKSSDVGIPRNTGDYRIITRRVIEELRALKERHGFLKGLVAFVGFKQTAVEYDRDKRFAGKTHYNRFCGSINVGLNGLFAFSSRPLQMMSISGFLITFISVIFAVLKILPADISSALSSTIIAVAFFSGVQLMCLGLMGEYVGRIYDEVKRRPLYIIDKVVDREVSAHKLPEGDDVA